MFIYGLWASGADVPFYIGKAANPYSRLYGHICSAKRKRWYSARLINSLLLEGAPIELRILARCEEDAWEDTERAFIAAYAGTCKLANTAEGGRGGITRRRGFHNSAEHCRNVGLAHKGKRLSETQKKALSEFAKTRTFAKNSRARAVIQCALTGKAIREWDCAKRAAVEGGFCSSKITACCKGRRKSSGGFIWRYKRHIQLQLIH